MMRIVLVGLSYKTAPVDVRERLSFSQSELEAGLVKLREKKNVEECVIISTCNRVEVYAVSGDTDDCVEEIKEFLSEFHKVPIEFFSPYLYVSAYHVAVGHLFRVASSLDSMVIGEPQILGQVKEAYKTADLKGTTGHVLNRLFHSAFFTAKKVRTETEIGSRAVSVGCAAAQLAKRIFDDLSKRTIMIIGAGDMAELIAKHLAGAGVRDLIISSRTLQSAESLARRLEGKPIKIEDIYNVLKDVDIVITATSSPAFVIETRHVRETLKQRGNEPVFMIDLAVPRDIDPQVGEIPSVYLYNIDDLQDVLEENLRLRREHMKLAEEIILQGEMDFQAWLDGLKIVPAIISLKKRFEEIKTAEVEKALRKFGDLSERERKIVEGMAAGIVGKILHGPMKNLKRELSTLEGAMYVDTLKKLFELDVEFLEDREVVDGERAFIRSGGR